MAGAYAGIFPDRSFGDSIEAFVAGVIPQMLQPIVARVRGMHPGVRRFSVLLMGADGLSLSRRTDSDGKVEHCPTDLAFANDNPVLAAMLRTGRPRSGDLRSDPALDWSGGPDNNPLVACPIGDSHRAIGFLILEGVLPSAVSGRVVRELTAWAPVLASLLSEGMKAIRTLIGTILVAHDFTLLRDHETGRHQQRITSYLHILSRQMSKAHGLPEGFADELAVFGSLHDIGKIGIADAILLKPGRFDCIEWEQMKEHVTIGRDLVGRMKHDLHLEGTPGLSTLEAVVSHHHEYLDGSGYPDGLGGEDIPLVARLVTTADIFDALTCSRPYKRPWSIEEAFEHLDRLAGTKIDRDCVAAMHSARTDIAAALHAHTARPGSESGDGSSGSPAS